MILSTNSSLAKDFLSVRKARELAILQLTYYLEMMKEAHEDRNQRVATAQSPSRTLSTA